MAERGTVGELFEWAIRAERQAESFYVVLRARFAHHPQVAEFWRQYAVDEAAHARELGRLREMQSTETLAAPADAEALSKARSLASFDPDHALSRLQDLEDTYQLVNEVENGETNVVFDFLLAHFSAEATARDMMRSQLNEHVNRLVREFPPLYSTAAIRRTATLLPSTQD